jgi:TRAP-type C4-dicarboxylate transport system permease small subunit
MNIPTLVRTAYKYICKAEVALCCAGFIGLVSMVFISAFLRFFRLSLAWNIDMAMLLLAWTAFLGADIAWRQGQLVGVDILVRSLPAKLQTVIKLLILLIVLAALAIIVYFGFRLAHLERLRRFQSLPIPFSIVTLSIVIACVSMVISTFIKIKEEVARLFVKLALGAATKEVA